MKKTLTAIALAAASLSAYAQEPVILKVAHFWPPTALSQQKVLEPWCAKIAKESNNQMQCQIYPAMQLGGTPPQLIQQAMDGVADIVWTLPGYTAGRFPAVEVLELPFLNTSAEAGSRAAWDIYQKYGQKDFPGIKALAFHVHDRGQIHNNKRPITQVADFKGLKMRAPTRLTNKLLAALGATPVAMPMPQTPDAVSKGVVDGYLLPWEVVPTMKLHEMTKYHSEISSPAPALYTAVFTIAMNQAKYDSLPPNLKKVIDDNSGAEFSRSIGKVWDESAASSRQPAVDRGNQFNTIDAANLAGFEKAGAKVTEGWIKEVTAKGYPGQAMVDDARRLAKEYAK